MNRIVKLAQDGGCGDFKSVGDRTANVVVIIVVGVEVGVESWGATVGGNSGAGVGNSGASVRFSGAAVGGSDVPVRFSGAAVGNSDTAVPFWDAAGVGAGVGVLVLVGVAHVPNRNSCWFPEKEVVLAPQ